MQNHAAWLFEILILWSMQELVVPRRGRFLSELGIMHCLCGVPTQYRMQRIQCMEQFVPQGHTYSMSQSIQYCGYFASRTNFGQTVRQRIYIPNYNPWEPSPDLNTGISCSYTRIKPGNAAPPSIGYVTSKGWVIARCYLNMAFIDRIRADVMLRIMKMDDSGTVLYPNEIDAYLESLQIFDISEIGSLRWFQQQERIYKLSLQATVEAKFGGHETLKEEIIIHQKVPVLVHELIAIELWRLKILPHLLKSDSATKSTIQLYIVLYHEITILSFLETILFHENVMESATDTLVDLVDYCYRKIVTFKSIKPEEIREDSGTTEESERIFEQKNKIDFESGMKCICIVSSMTQHKNIVPLSVLHRLLVVHDVPLLFTDIVCNPPWIRETDGKTEKYTDGKWRTVSHGELMKLSKIEGQLWIALIQLLLDPDCQKKYDMSGFRKDQILKLRSKLNEVVMDQIPILNELLRYLQHLTLFDAPIPKSGIIIELIPEIWEGLQESNKNKWKKIAKEQAEKHFSLSEKELQEFCTRVSGSFDQKNIEVMLSESPMCANCHNKGDKRCSRCKNEWYCGRSCQVSHWAKHKPACDLIASEK